MMIQQALGLIASLAVVFTLVLKRKGIGKALLIGSFILGISTLGPHGLTKSFVQAILDERTSQLTAAIASISLLGATYKVTGLLDDLSNGLRKAIPSDFFVMEFIPAIFGLLPVLGGALMSAPVIDVVGNDVGLDPEEKTFINLWFRHVVFLIYPVGPSLLLAAYLAGLEVRSLLIAQLPVFLASLLAGQVVWLSRGRRKIEVSPKGSFSGKKLFIALFPIILVAIFGVLGRWLVTFGVLIALAFLWVVGKLRSEELKESLKQASIAEMILIGISVMTYRSVIEASGVAKYLAGLIGGKGIPEILVLILIPCLLGFTLGVPSGTVALSVSIISSFISLGPFETGLVLTCSILGYVISPLHACYTLTAEYFRANMLRAYKYLLPVSLITIASGALLTLVLGS